MAVRIRRFVDDRTFLLTAMGHDLRTPITRLRLRAEFMQDEEQRRRMISDLDELEAMVSATLAFGPNATLAEPATKLNLAAIALHGPSQLAVIARPVAMKRALINLVANALNYGGSAHATLHPAADGMPGCYNVALPAAVMAGFSAPSQAYSPS